MEKSRFAIIFCIKTANSNAEDSLKYYNCKHKHMVLDAKILDSIKILDTVWPNILSPNVLLYKRLGQKYDSVNTS